MYSYKKKIIQSIFFTATILRKIKQNRGYVSHFNFCICQKTGQKDNPLKKLG